MVTITMNIKAILLTYNSFVVTLEKEINLDNLSFSFKENKAPVEVFLNKVEGLNLYFTIAKKIVLGNEYVFTLNGFKSVHLDMTRAVDFKDFDLKYAYYQNDLGATYSKEYTDFALWAPLSYKVQLKYYLKNKAHIILMKRTENGVYRARVNEDLKHATYVYINYVNNNKYEVIDPYAKSSTSNGKRSAVIDMSVLDSIKIDNSNLPPFKNNVEAIIYELSVRDFTINKNTDIINKGKFLGLTEEGRKTRKGNPAGLDYLKMLGVTHVQLLPVMDFKTVDEDNPDKKYNWGYDPQQYFALEGSYSTDPNNPYTRMKEFKMLVKALHNAGIRVNLDVVYNHMYDVRTTSLQQIVPFYYFRHTSDYHFIEHSYCGDDVASERAMAKKLIVDSISFMLNTYDVDGFRFDLMGLIDIVTMKEIERIGRSFKPNLMLYGEGWDMYAETSTGVGCAHMNNAHLLPNIGFFNDRFRNIARGPGGETPLDEPGYLLGNENYYDGFKFVFLGSTLDVTFPHIFVNLNQSINYVECHDNATLFDAIDTTNRDSQDEIIQRIKMINKAILFSFGVPFIHAGQEIGLTKFGNGNTYNKGDKYNQFDYDLLDKRYEASVYFSKCVKQRKSLPFFKICDPKQLEKIYDFNRIHDTLFIRISYKEFDKNLPNYYFVVNPSKKTIYHTFKQKVCLYSLVDNLDESLESDNSMIFPLSFKVFFEKKETN